MSVTAPRGFLAAGVAAGLKASGRPDLALLVAERPAAAAGLFTTNAFPAAPVTLSRRNVAGGWARAVVVNSGQANAGTGPPGMADAEATAVAVAEATGADPSSVLVCSTGVIGPRVRLRTLLDGLPAATAALSAEGGPDFARAILTTDRVPKQTVVEEDGFRVGGCAKGAGMVAPRLGTMLAFLTTDAKVDPGTLDRVTRRFVRPVFEGLTVDGCASTNDTVLVLASGASGAEPSPEVLGRALAEAATDLVRRLAADAEGATKVLVVHVDGAASDQEAGRVGLAVAGSLLVKTALFGEDPNVGRLLQAVGASGVPFDPSQVRIALADIPIAEGGTVLEFDQRAARDGLKEREVVAAITVGDGPGEATCFGCDLGYEYVRINAEYTT